MNKPGKTVREFIHAESTDEVIFTRGTTESINLRLTLSGEAFIREGDEIIVTETNIMPILFLGKCCERKKAVLKVVPFNDKGELDMEVFRGFLNERVKLVGVAYVSNVLGTVNPVKEMIDAAHAIGAYALLMGLKPFNISRLTCRYWIVIFAFSGHKVYGPTGVGILYGKRNLLEQMPPWQGGEK